MSNEVQVSKDFQERLFEKIRADIGALMTEEELKSVVSKSVERAFFEKEVKIQPRSYGSYVDRVEGEPVIYRVVRELMQKRVETATDQFLKNNEARLVGIIEEVLKDGLIRAVTRIIDERMKQPMVALQNSLVGIVSLNALKTPGASG